MPTHRKTDESKNYQLFKQLTRELTDLSSTMEALAWDQETMMPAKGVPFRARQVATLATIHHQKLTDSRLGGLLDELESEALDFWGRAHLREARREYDKAVKLPPALVRDLASTSTLAYQAWVKARQEVDFESFAPWLEKMVDLKRRQARILAGGSRLYDALLDEFEPALTSDEADSIFAVLGPRLSRLRERVETASPLSRDEVLCGHFPRAGQEAFGRTVLTAMGFDWEAGRLDTSPHPFCCGLSPLDVRITTRYSEEDFSASFFGMVHEAGHALYEQGLNSEQFGLPAGTTVSFGIHESQSRLWENFVARSYAFWECWLPRLREVFPAQF
ncbi:MAG: carboxypeptidase M32, partial [Acidobacteriota bacterium]